MTDLLKTGSDWLETKRTAALSTSAVYTRGEDSVTINLTKGRSDFQVIDQENGFGVESRTEDFIALAADLILAGAVIKPAHGDKITMDSIEYEVLNAPDGGCWQYSDQFGKAIRIHTKRITE